MGQEIVVRVTSATDSELFGQIGGRDTRLSVSEIRRVSYRGRDSLRNGALMGAGGGALLGAFGCQGGTDSCSIPGSIAVCTLMFGALGTWIDSSRDGRVVVYKARR
jgi:hypothetical protein